jgi:hypothetical protein
MEGPSDVVNLAADDVHAAYYCAAEVMRHRQRAGQPIRIGSARTAPGSTPQPECRGRDMNSTAVLNNWNQRN